MTCLTSSYSDQMTQNPSVDVVFPFLSPRPKLISRWRRVCRMIPCSQSAVASASKRTVVRVPLQFSQPYRMLVQPLCARVKSPQSPQHLLVVQSDVFCCFSDFSGFIWLLTGFEIARISYFLELHALWRLSVRIDFPTDPSCGRSDCRIVRFVRFMVVSMALCLVGLEVK